MNLLVDIGNTRCKWATYNSSGIVSGQPVFHQQGNFQKTLINLWSDIEQPQQLAIACVGPMISEQQVEKVAKQLWPATELVKAKSVATAFGVQNAYHQAEKLGVDRWLCLLALQQYHQLPACVVACGTAITIDIINAQGVHQGGVIAPGLTLMKQALCNATRNLEYKPRSVQNELGTNTDSAIDSGTLLAAIGLVETVIAKHAKEMNLYITGGDSEFLAQHLSADFRIEADLVLQGLSVILNTHL